MSLTPKRRAFADAYTKSWNATQAAKAAGYKNPRTLGSRLTKVDSVQDYIAERLSEQTMDADEALQRLAQVARGEFAEFVTDEGTLDIPRMRKEGKVHLIKAIRHSRYGPSIEFADMLSALTTIAKHHGLLTDRVQVEAGLNIRPEDVAAADALLREFLQQMDERASEVARR